jgi:hypothetical protein
MHASPDDDDEVEPDAEGAGVGVFAELLGAGFVSLVSVFLVSVFFSLVMFAPSVPVGLSALQAIMARVAEMPRIRMVFFMAGGSVLR